MDPIHGCAKTLRLVRSERLAGFLSLLSSVITLVNHNFASPQLVDCVTELLGGPSECVSYQKALPSHVSQCLGQETVCVALDPHFARVTAFWWSSVLVHDSLCPPLSSYPPFAFLLPCSSLFACNILQGTTRYNDRVSLSPRLPFLTFYL